MPYCITEFLDLNAGYDVEDHTNLPSEPHSSTVPPAVAAGLGNYSNPESTKKARNRQASVASLPYHSHSSLIYFVMLLFLLL